MRRPRHDGGFLDEGRVLLFHGAPTGISHVPAWFADGGQEGEQLGSSVAAAGDVNGHGCGDVIVGARLVDDGEIDEGRAVIFLGSPAGLATQPAWIVEGGQNGARFGASVASAGDVNGDGFADVIVGAPLYDHVYNENEGGGVRLSRIAGRSFVDLCLGMRHQPT